MFFCRNYNEFLVKCMIYYKNKRFFTFRTFFGHIYMEQLKSARDTENKKNKSHQDLGKLCCLHSKVWRS